MSSINTNRNRSLQLFEQTGLALMKLENALFYVTCGMEIAETKLAAIERQVRKLREVTDTLWTAQIIQSDGTLSLAELGIKPSLGKDYIEIEFPYHVVTKTTLYRVYSKEISRIPSLIHVRRAWGILMSHIIKQYSKFPFSTPLTNANIIVTVLVPDMRQRDPDHYWFRPLLDGLVLHGILSDDTTSNVDLSFRYETDTNRPAVIVQVQVAGEAQWPAVRKSTLVPADEIVH